MTTGGTPLPGLRPDWLNSWLAAIGILHLLPDARLCWTNPNHPTAHLHHPHADTSTGFAELLADALPTVDDHDRSALARHHAAGGPELPRKVDPAAYWHRSNLVRTQSPWDRTLEATLTDLGDPANDPIVHAPFDPPMPKGITLNERVRTCRTGIDSLAATNKTTAAQLIARTLVGPGARLQTNGLGFDATRRAPGVQAAADVMVDPVIECLAFEGIQLFPFRGNGRVTRQRGFTDKPSARHSFRWPTWSPALDLWAFDALYDAVQTELTRTRHHLLHRGPPARIRRLGVTAIYGTVYQQPRSSSDTYRAFSSERIQ